MAQNRSRTLDTPRTRVDPHHACCYPLRAHHTTHRCFFVVCSPSPRSSPSPTRPVSCDAPPGRTLPVSPARSAGESASYSRSPCASESSSRCPSRVAVVVVAVVQLSSTRVRYPLSNRRFGLRCTIPNAKRPHVPSFARSTFRVTRGPNR